MIPFELKTANQWVNWDLIDGKKVPLNPNVYGPASVTNPATWGTYAQSASNAPLCPHGGIGVVLTADDPYVVIDLDSEDGQLNAVQCRIMAAFEGTYVERSPSGNGFHIWLKGPAGKGCRASKHGVEVYSQARFITITGFGQGSIQPGGELLAALYDEIEAQRHAKHDHGINRPQIISDTEVIRQAANARNGEKFKALYEGRWQGAYPSQSEADQALMNVFAFYSQNRQQLARLFHQSALGKRKKAKRADYLGGTIARALDQQLPPVAMSEMLAAGRRMLGFE